MFRLFVVGLIVGVAGAASPIPGRVSSAAAAAEKAGQGGVKGLPGKECWSLARLKYGGGGDWYSGPTMLPNLARRLRSDIGLDVCAEEKVVAPLDGNLYAHPILFMTGHGNVAFSEEERRALREYLLRGGLLFADDNYGLDSSFRREMKALFPNHALVPLGAGHPVFSAHHRMAGLPKVHQHDGKRATAYGIEVEGRTLVFYSYESDLGNGWEDPEVHKDPAALREQALRMGVKVVAWFLQGAPTGATGAPTGATGSTSGAASAKAAGASGGSNP